jgi:hypothetical protein
MAEDGAAEQAAVIDELSQAIAGEILTLPELSDPAWDTYAMVAEVDENRVGVTAYRYTESGPPVATESPDNTFLFWQLRDETQGPDGHTWDVVIVKIHRDTANLVLDFVSGAEAEPWRVNPANIMSLPEKLRPRPEDFGPVPQPEPAPVVEPPVPTSTSAPLVVEVLTDGGIRLTTLDGATGLASLRATRDWIAEAQRAGAPVHLRGDLTAAPVRPVVDEVRRLAPALEEQPSAPTSWPQGHSSLQTAAWNGLTEQTSDLLDRGTSPNVGRGAKTPYRLAMQHGHVDVLAALLAAGAAVPRGLQPPADLPGAVVLRAYPARWVWWTSVPFLVLAVLAALGGEPGIAPIFLLLPIVMIGSIHLILGNTRCAIDGPQVARRRGWRWQGPIDLRTLDALGRTPQGTPRMPVLWELGQREAGDKPNVYARSAFSKEQLATLKQLDGLRFVPLFAKGGFLSPGFERLLAQHVDPSKVIVGHLAKERVWPV